MNLTEKQKIHVEQVLFLIKMGLKTVDDILDVDIKAEVEKRLNLHK